MHSITTTLLVTGVLALAQTEVDLKAKLDAEMRAVKVNIASAQFGLVGDIVKGAPYSAEAVVFNQDQADDQMTDEQVLSAIYADPDEAR